MTKISIGQPKALVIHCSDPRFQQAFHDFIRNNLGLRDGEYIPIVVPGSVAALGTGISVIMPKSQRALLDQIQVMLKHNQGETLRVILINHEDCKGYAEVFGKLRRMMAMLPDVIERQVSDLSFAVGLIKAAAKRFNVHCQPEMYMARISEGQEVVFDQYEFTK